MNLDKFFAWVIGVVMMFAVTGKLDVLQSWIWSTQAIKQIVLAHDKLAFWFFKDADEKGSGERHLKLVRDEQSEVGVSLVSGDNFSDSNLSVQGLDIGKIGDTGMTRTFDLLLRRQLLYPTELRYRGILK